MVSDGIGGYQGQVELGLLSWSLEGTGDVSVCAVCGACGLGSTVGRVGCGGGGGGVGCVQQDIPRPFLL
jgi:hypothetical protein